MHPCFGYARLVLGKNERIAYPRDHSQIVLSECAEGKTTGTRSGTTGVCGTSYHSCILAR